MKRDINLFVERLKAEHHHPHGKLQRLEAPLQKWEQITMEFDAMWLIFDHLTMSAHFLTIQDSSPTEKLADSYV